MQARARRRIGVEWPTVALAAAIYGGWAAVVWWHAELTPWLAVPLGAWFVAWQSSLQHEVSHGHPTRWPLANALVGIWSLWLWVPFHRYRAIHLVHHRDARLTDPLDDPESLYLTAEGWAALGPAGRALVRLQRTLAGRLLVGPAWSVATFLAAEARLALAGDRAVVRAWAVHAPAAAAILAFVLGAAGMPPWQYLLIVYAGTALASLRSFAEHRAADDVRHRTAIVEDAPVLGLLFLYNNLHVVHHDRPGLPWYRIPAAYRAERERLIARNGGLVYRGYADVARRFLFRMHDDPVHPAERPGALRAAPAPAGGVAAE
jgi:fatty acid desaturase